MDSTDFRPTIEVLTRLKADLWMAANLNSHGQDHIRRLARLWDESQQDLRVIIAAWSGDVFCGHVTILWQSNYPPFRKKNIPEIVDLWVEPDHRRQGIATKLLTALERIVRERKCPAIGLGVGVTATYGPAQRLYSEWGFIPDGTGLWAAGKNIAADATVLLDDGATLMMVKPL